jgi:N-acetylglucosamine-6-phosphate deacetylase
VNLTGQQSKRPLALVNGRVILPQEIVEDSALLVEGAKVLGLTETGTLESEVQRINVAGRFIAPGLIDIHTHGALGHSFDEATAEAFTIITEEQARRGVTGLLVTTATAPIADLVECLDFSQRWVQNNHSGAQILGVHVEGPYFSLAQSGAQDPMNIRNPDDGTFEELLAYHRVIKMMSYAPELPGAIDLTRKLVSLGVIPAAGHSSAKEDEVRVAMDAGLCHSIHIWSAQSTTVREGPWRKPGLLEVTLVDESLTAEMIADNKHLPVTLMRLAYKCLGPDRLCLISDATSGAGLAEGARFRMGEMEYEVHDGVGMMLDRSSFAGSTTLLNQMIPVMTEVLGIPLVEAVRMASLTPARIIDVAEHKGSLEAGKDADIAIFENDFSVWRTMIGGRWAYIA